MVEISFVGKGNWEAIEGWNQQKIGEFLLQRNVRWLFNPPGGSHYGGIWERCIRTVRKVMGALRKEQILDDEGLATLLCEVESIVNGRSVTKVSDGRKIWRPSHQIICCCFTQDLRHNTVSSPNMKFTPADAGDRFNT